MHSLIAMDELSEVMWNGAKFDWIINTEETSGSGHTALLAE